MIIFRILHIKHRDDGSDRSRGMTVAVAVAIEEASK